MWTHDLYQRMTRNFSAFQFDVDEASAWAEWVKDLDPGMVERAANSLMMRPPFRFPMGMEVRRRVLADVGLLAPSYAESQRMLSDYAAKRLAWDDVPGPVRATYDPFAVAAGRHEIDSKAAYEAVAEAHDQVVEQPGGLDVLCAAGVWLAAVQARVERVALARQCAGGLREPPEVLPGSGISDVEADGWIARWEAENATLPQLVSRRDPDESWGEPAPRVAALIAARGLLHRRVVDA